jgi:hypothetical protein
VAGELLGELDDLRDDFDRKIYAARNEMRHLAGAAVIGTRVVSGHRAAVTDELPGRYPDRAPAARPLGSHIIGRSAPRVMISPGRILIPPHTGMGSPEIGNATRIISAGTAKSAIRGSFSSPADIRKRCSAICVNRARNSPCPVTSIPRQPSSRKAASKSAASLNTEVTLPGISINRLARLLGGVTTSFRVPRRCDYSFLANSTGGRALRTTHVGPRAPPG